MDLHASTCRSRFRTLGRMLVQPLCPMHAILSSSFSISSRTREFDGGVPGYFGARGERCKGARGGYGNVFFYKKVKEAHIPSLIHSNRQQS